MKSTLLFFVITFFTTYSFSQDLEPSSSEVYQAIEDLAVYIHDKDSSFNASQVYRDILTNSSEVGIERALIIPTQKLLKFERVQTQRVRLQKIADLLPAPRDSEDDPASPFRRRIDIVANSKNECVGQCIRDVVNTAAGGATIGVSIGGVGGAAGGAIIGAALGGAACATSPQCDKDKDKDKDKNKIIISRDFDLQPRGDIREDIKKKRDIVVNPGPKRVRGW